MRIWKLCPYAHISGRATVAVWGMDSGNVYGCRYTKMMNINKQENFMEV